MSLLETGIAHGENVAPLQILLAGILTKRGALERATKLLDKALAANPDDKTRADALYNMGEVAYVRRFMREEGEWQTALDYHNQALDLRRAIPDPRGQCHSMSRIGIIYERQDDDDTAQDYYQQVIELADSIPYPLGKTRPYTHIAAYLLRQDDTAAALDYFQKCLAISEEDGQADVLLFSTANVGMGLLRHNNDVEGVLERLDQAVSMAETLDHRLAMGIMYYRIGKIYTETDQPERARMAYEQVIAISEPVGFSFFATAAREAIQEL